MTGIAKRKQKTAKLRDPLEPLMTVNRILLRLLALAAGAALLALPFGHGEIPGWGRDHLCVSTDGMGGGDFSGMKAFLRLHSGVGAGTTGLNLCTEAPSAGQRWWYSLQAPPTTVTVVVPAVTTYLLLRQAQRNGLYTPGIAVRIRFLGWFLVADSLLRPTIEVYASHRLWATMADSSMPTNWNPVWAFLFAGIALLSLARIMGVGTAMREDLEGVV